MRWTHAFAHNMAWAAIRSRFVPVEDYGVMEWNGQLGRYESVSYVTGLAKPRIYPGKRWARV